MSSVKVNYWISYSDLMAGLLFVLLSIIVISNYQHKSKEQELKSKLDNIDEAIDLRKKIARSLSETFEENEVDGAIVDPKTGDIAFKITQGWFRNESAELLPRAKSILDEVMPYYLSVLFDESITQEKLERILIEGHASHESDIRYLQDLELSQKRALSVAKYVLNSNRMYKERLRKHLVGLGRSFADARYLPSVSLGQTILDKRRSEDRRVVVRYALDYEGILNQLANE